MARQCLMSVTRRWHVLSHVPSPRGIIITCPGQEYVTLKVMTYLWQEDGTSLDIYCLWIYICNFMTRIWHVMRYGMKMRMSATSRRHVLICFSCTGATLAIQGSRSGQKLILENKWINMEAWGEHKVLPLILNLITCYFCSFLNFI